MDNSFFNWKTKTNQKWKLDQNPIFVAILKDGKRPEFNIHFQIEKRNIEKRIMASVLHFRIPNPELCFKLKPILVRLFFYLKTKQKMNIVPDSRVFFAILKMEKRA